MTLKPKELYRRFRAWQKDPVNFRIKKTGVHHCPNCGNEFEGNYCPVCRQDVGDGRITWKWVYECVMTVWGMDSRSMPHTLLQLLFRPGYLISDYINGRRQVSYTPVNMLFIVALVYVIIKQLLGAEPSVSVEENEKAVDAIMYGSRWMSEHPGWGMMIMTMMLIIPTRYIFRFAPRHTRHTLPEGIIIQVYMSTLMLMVALMVRITPLLVWLIPFYYYAAYRQLFGYGVWGTLWRTVLCIMAWAIVFFLVIYIVVILNGDYDKGEEVAMMYSTGEIVANCVIVLFILGLAAAVIAVGYFISRRGYKKAQTSR